MGHLKAPRDKNSTKLSDFQKKTLVLKNLSFLLARFAMNAMLCSGKRSRTDQQHASRKAHPSWSFDRMGRKDAEWEDEHQESTISPSNKCRNGASGDLKPKRSESSQFDEFLSTLPMADGFVSHDVESRKERTKADLRELHRLEQQIGTYAGQGVTESEKQLLAEGLDDLDDDEQAFLEEGQREHRTSLQTLFERAASAGIQLIWRNSDLDESSQFTEPVESQEEIREGKKPAPSLPSLGSHTTNYRQSMASVSSGDEDTPQDNVNLVKRSLREEMLLASGIGPASAGLHQSTIESHNAIPAHSHVVTSPKEQIFDTIDLSDTESERA